MPEETTYTKEQIRNWLLLRQGQTISQNDIVKAFNIDAHDQLTLVKYLDEFIQQDKIIKLATNRFGVFKVIRDVKPVSWWEADTNKYFDLTFPRSHSGDGTTFGFNDMINVNENDVIIPAGVSNFGKTALALNFLAENIDKPYGCVLMGNEYATSDNRPLPQFKRRLENMKWVKWFNEDGSPKFDMIPVADDYEEHIQPGKLNIIDWIALPADAGFWMVQNIVERIKAVLGGGVAIVILQKSRSKEFGDGGEFSERLAQCYFNLDAYGDNETRLTVGKVKDYKKWVTGRSWAFRMVDHGANLSDIREIKKCRTCYGKGRSHEGKECFDCNGTGWTKFSTTYVSDEQQAEDEMIEQEGNCAIIQQEDKQEELFTE